MLSRFRLAWLSQNGLLLVLRLLQESSLSEYEILSRLHARYGLTPNAREFGRIKKTLLGKGYARLDSGLGADNLQITSAGVRLLRLLEEEYRGVVSNMARLENSSSGAVAH
jgi:hypothetical protein